MSPRKIEPCPRCGQLANIVPIVYGMPDEATRRRFERGEVALGGCEIDERGMPTLRCTACRLDFASKPFAW
ncbi:MAG TPA: hypothetical protein V6D47_09465 [Oscillatoriaceae cyanobacterium]